MKQLLCFIKPHSRQVTHYCVTENVNPVKTTLCVYYRMNISSRFDGSSEARVLEFL